jgi:hypothetical protein
MKTLHPRIMYTHPRGGVQGGGYPPVGSGGKRALDKGSGAKAQKEKLPCKCIL